MSQLWSRKSITNQSIHQGLKAVAKGAGKGDTKRKKKKKKKDLDLNQ
jgi:hypothetical protein